MYGKNAKRIQLIRNFSAFIATFCIVLKIQANILENQAAKRLRELIKQQAYAWIAE
ncbi:MAG: hypothetical protein QXS81_02555 [Candidatus Micrarchaeaceae archaeon]